ncbi:AIPR family protein [uncultured Neptuniibacter sp.]|uniref:AIPR family protein n=1 Tax=uncultured Neptuniibacter sp. TaxID=502143 RepID=UPI00262C1996|nr:AIPR family protein [uncultured Neptuniibacter sp.]
MNEVDLEEYRRRLISEVSDPSNELVTSEYPVERFTEYVTSIIAESGSIQDLSIGHIEKSFGASVVHCDAWAADLSEGRLDLVIAYYSGKEEPEAINRAFLDTLCRRALRIIDFSQKTDLSEIEPSSKTYDCVSLIKESFSKINQIRLHFVTDSLISARDTPDIQGPEGTSLQLHLWDIQRLSRMQSSDKAYEAIEIDLVAKFGKSLPCLSMPGNSTEYSGYLAIIPGSWLAELYEEYSGQLMELNVRSFLQQKGNVNKGIRNTILNEPTRFLAYNNGISATVESLTTKRDSSGQEVITHLAGLQIVNGGQTVASIHRARKFDRCSHLDQLAVQAKITKVNPDQLDELVPQISRYSNTQNRVNEADFASNDSFHVEIERLSQSVWAPGQQYRWFYERARGQYQVAKARASTTPAKRRIFEDANPPRRKFAKTDLARYQNAWDQKPHIVGLGAQKSFIHYMTQVKKDRTLDKPDVDFFKDLIAKAIIYKKAESIARKHAFSAYRANAVAYTVSLLSQKTYGRLMLRKIWDRQEVTPVVEQVIFDWMPGVHRRIVDTANGRNVTEWAKKEECWEEVQQLDLKIPSELEAELTEGDQLPTVGAEARKGKFNITTEDRKNIAIAMSIDSDTWWQITKWGRKDNRLSDFHCGLSNTLAGYAAGSWEKIPSAKQAKHAATIIQNLKDEGILNDLKEKDTELA